MKRVTSLGERIAIESCERIAIESCELGRMLRKLDRWSDVY